MTKQEAKKTLIEWLDDANHHRVNIKSGNYFTEQIGWFRRCEEMFAAYLVLSKDFIGNDMPIDLPSPEFVFDDLPENAFDGVNGFERQ